MCPRQWSSYHYLTTVHPSSHCTAKGRSKKKSVSFILMLFFKLCDSNGADFGSREMLLVPHSNTHQNVLAYTQCVASFVHVGHFRVPSSHV